MAGYDINVGRDLLPGLLSGQNGLENLVETVLNQILEAQVTVGQTGMSVQTSGRATVTAIGRVCSTLALALMEMVVQGFLPARGGIRNHRGTMRRELLQINGQ